jgi:PPOX class probable F420-dependent enzyme
MSGELSEKARAFLREKRFAVLATINKDGTPQLTTMWYLLENDGTIMMNTRAGRSKELNMRRDPRISVCFEDGYRYLTIKGRVEMIDDAEISQRDIYRLSARYHGEEIAKKQVKDQFSKEKRVTLRLKPESVVEYF